MVPSHPTILIGLGQYGRTVMRRLLQEGLDQGALVWDDPPKEEGPGARTLRNLAFLWVPLERGEDTDPDGDLAKDLYGQIHEIVPENAELRGSMRGALAAAAVAAKDRLLDASRKEGEGLRLGLDVIVLAQPSGPESPGRFENLLEPMMDALADDRSLERAGQGTNLLNFLLFLDFDNYWESPEATRRLRTELQDSVARWHARQVTFSRIYLMDGQVKAQGRRSADLRTAELIILLGLMLFDGKRDDAGLRGLFEKEKDEIPPLSTFGVRALERRQDLLALLSAARFAAGWLDYLLDKRPAGGNTADSVRAQLAPYDPASFDLSEDRQALEKLVDAGLREIEHELQSISAAADEPGRLKELGQRAERLVSVLKSRILSWSSDSASRAFVQKLGNLPEKLKEVVTEGLVKSTRPVPLGMLFNALTDLRTKLLPGQASVPVADAPDQFAALGQAQQEFGWFRTSQVNPANLGRLWPLLAAVMGAAWTPIVLDAFDTVTEPAASDGALARQAYQFMMLFNRPWLIVVLLTGLAWLIGSKWFEPQMRKWLARGRLGWQHQAQGKLADRFRQAIRSGAIADSIRAYAEHSFRTASLRIQGEIGREIDRVIQRLDRRRREMQWLRNEMREFLRTHGIDPDSDLPAIDSDVRPGGYRTFLDRDSDFQRILALNPPTADRYQSAQVEKKPLELWPDEYCDTFLYPVIFLEKLSKDYFETREPATGNEGEESRIARGWEIKEFLDNTGQFPLAFDWSTASGAVPDMQKWCLLPARWKRLPHVEAALDGQAIIPQRIVEASAADRAYLLKVQWGVSETRLTRHGEGPRVPGEAAGA